MVPISAEHGSEIRLQNCVHSPSAMDHPAEPASAKRKKSYLVKLLAPIIGARSVAAVCEPSQEVAAKYRQDFDGCQTPQSLSTYL